MALTNFTKNYGIVSSSPNTNFRVFNHNSGASQSDKQLIVVVTMANTVNFGNATYNGVTMTPVLSQNFTGLSQRQRIYTLASPTDGTNQFRVDFTGNQWNGVSIACYTFIGCSGIGNFGINGGSTTPNSKTLNCSNGSIIVATGISNNAFQNFSIDGASLPTLYQHNINKQTAGAISNNVSAGVIDVTSVVNTGNVTNVRVEMLEAGGTPPTGNSGNFLIMFN
jgi:hypothetical protein